MEAIAVVTILLVICGVVGYAFAQVRAGVVRGMESRDSPGIVENLIVAAKTRAQAARDEAVVRAATAAAERALLEQVVQASQRERE